MSHAGWTATVCFAHAVADNLVYDQVHNNPCIEDILDYEVQQFMLLVLSYNANILIAKCTGFVHVRLANTATTTEELKDPLQKEEANFCFNPGYMKPTANVDISEKEIIIRTIWLHYVFFRPHCELVCLNPEKVHGLLATSTSYNITPKFFLEEFAIHYSDAGCNNRTKEEAVILH